MFAHQVIEDAYSEINWLDSITSEQRNKWGQFDKALKEAIRMIKESQKFHFGDHRSVDSLFTKDAGKQVYIDSDCGNLRLPYKIMWADYTDPMSRHISKIGILTTQITETFWHMMHFAYNTTHKSWQLYPVVNLILIGGLTPENEKMLKKVYPLHNFDLTDKRITNLSVNVRGCGEIINRDSSSIDADINENVVLFRNTILLMNCKNIQTEKIPAPEALNKKRRKAGKQELFDYHVLNVVVPSKKRGYHESTEPLSHNRVHLCRGHFKEYTAEHPLFGHYTGLYWWQPHVRGQNRDGVVMKDYNVKAA